jgi:hypothetical protein
VLTTGEAVAVWKPWVVAAWCFVFPPAGALLYYLNVRAIGDATRGLLAIAVITVGTVLVVALPIVLHLGLPPNTVALLNVVSMAVLYFDWRDQLEAATERRLGTREAPWSTSFLWALPVTLAGYGAIALVIRAVMG